MLDAGRHLRGRRSTRPSRRCSTSSTTTSRSKRHDARRRRRRVRQGRPGRARPASEVHRHQPVPMECRGLIADWDAAAEHLTIHASTQSPHMYRMLLPAQIDVPMEKIRVLAGDVGGGFGLKNGVGREEVAVVAASIDLGRPVKWIEDRLEHLAVGRPGPRGEGRHRGRGHRRRRAARRAHGRQAQPGRLRLRPVHRRDLRRCRSAARSRAPRRSRASPRQHTAVFSNKATYVAYRGPWATGDFLRERLLDIIARELGLDPLDVRRRNYVAARRAAARHAHRPAVRRRHHPGAASSRRRRSSTGTASGGARPRRARDGRYLGHRHRRRTSRRRRGRGAPARPGMDAMILGEEATHVSLERRRQSSDRHPPAAPRPGPRDDARRRSRPTSSASGSRTCRSSSATPTSRPFALVGTGGSRAATHGERRRCSTARGELKEQDPRRSPPTCSRPAPPTSRSTSGVISVRGTPRRRSSRWPSWPASWREEPERLPDGADTELDGDPRVRRRPERLVGRHALLRGRGRRRDRARRRSSATSWSRTAACPSTPRSSRARSAAASPRGSARCSSSTRRTARTASSSRPRSWTTCCRRPSTCPTSRSTTSRPSSPIRTSTSGASARAG